MSRKRLATLAGWSLSNVSRGLHRCVLPEPEMSTVIRLLSDIVGVRCMNKKEGGCILTFQRFNELRISASSLYSA